MFLQEERLIMILKEPRKLGYSVVEGKDIIPSRFKALADAANVCCNAIQKKELPV